MSFTENKTDLPFPVSYIVNDGRSRDCVFQSLLQFQSLFWKVIAKILDLEVYKYTVVNFAKQVNLFRLKKSFVRNF